MVTYVNAAETTNKDYNEGYICQSCENIKESKPWVIYMMDDDKKCLCSYLCYKSMNVVDEKLWGKVMNKEDFNDLRPVLPKNVEKFVFYTNRELSQFDDNKLQEYYVKLNAHYMENPERASMQMEIMEESEYSDGSSSDYSGSDEEYYSE